MKCSVKIRNIAVTVSFAVLVLSGNGQSTDYLYDPTFTPPNIVGGNGGSVGSILVHDDSRIMVCGAFQFNWPYQIKKFVRFNDDGSIDESFSTLAEPMSPVFLQFHLDGYLYLASTRVAKMDFDGSVPTHKFLALNFSPYIPSVPPTPHAGMFQVMENDKIMVAGRFYPDTNNLADRRNLVRAMPDGSHDPTFEPLKCHEPDDAWIIDLYPTHDGKWMVAGQFMDIEGFVSPGIARLNGDFSVDTTFQSPFPNHNWNVRIAPGPDPYTLKGAIDELNRVYIKRTEPGHAYPLLGKKYLRLLDDGSIDTTFNVGEMTYYNHNDGENYPGSINSIVFEPDGALIIGGKFRTIEGELRGNIAKLNSDGSLIENVFHRQGADTANWQNGSNPDINVPSITTIVRLDNGGLLVGGLFSRYDGHDQWGLVRLLPSPVSVEENVQNTELKVFPNPASSHLWVSVPEQTQGRNCTVQIYNNAGKIIHETNAEYVPELYVPVHHLSSGMYFIKVFSDDFKGYGRFIKTQ